MRQRSWEWEGTEKLARDLQQLQEPILPTAESHECSLDMTRYHQSPGHSDAGQLEPGSGFDTIERSMWSPDLPGSCRRSPENLLKFSLPQVPHLANWINNTFSEKFS